jgi:glyoxylase-like metal-dependent hydrolase (beta-lactamase superfamily II)
MVANLFALLVTLIIPNQDSPQYVIEAIRYGTISQYPVAGLVVGAPQDERLDIAMMFWVIRGDGRNVLFDTGFYREDWMERFDIRDFLRPDQALRLAGLDADDVTDIIISHMHWDHVGGIDLFPNATIWIQKAEFEYYVGAAWQEGGRHGGIDPEDVLTMVRRNTEGKLRLIDGDDIEILPGIRAYTGGRHTFASQYILIETDPPYVLASDNCYLYRNLETRSPIPTFLPEDSLSNLAALNRMVSLAGAPDRVIPGHDALLFERFPNSDRVAVIFDE